MNELSNLLLNTGIVNDTIIYVRSSTNNQNNPLINSASQATQTTVCEQYCKDKKIHNSNNIQHETCSASGSIKQKILLNIINTNKNKTLICYDVTRFSRSHRYGTELIHKCIDNNLEVHFVRENIVVKDSKELHRFAMALLNAQNESDVLSARIKDSINFRKSNGTYNFIREKFGFDISKDNNNKKILKINHQEQQVIEEMLKLYYGCLSSEIKLENNIIDDSIIMYGNYGNSSIASFLNDNEILNKNKKWNANNIKNVIDKNCKYIQDRDALTEDLIIEMINMRSTINVNKYVVSVKAIYKKINKYKLTESNKEIGQIKNNYDMLMFLNRNVVNFKYWDNDELKKITDYHTKNINGKRIKYIEDENNRILKKRIISFNI
jgi:DNA invertase Pin-like site-specific DNA recombinase